MEVPLMDTTENLSEIIAGCKDRQAEAFSHLVDIYANRLYGYFYRLTSRVNVSEELLSEVFLKLVEKIGSYRDEASSEPGRKASFDKWLFTIAVNVFRDYLRARRREKRFLTWKERQMLMESQPGPKTADYATDNLQTQLGKLDDETRELLIMRYYSQLSFKQIAQVRSQPIGTVLSKVHRGLKKLRELMTEP
jgi:RNA polymerase sigma-70 factor (ECF subfamily)